jgi:hypothetical protein
VTAAEIRPHVQALERIAQTNGGNRAAGLPGSRATVDYLVAQLRAGDWRVTRQKITFPFYAVRSASITGLRHRRDFSVVRFSGTGRVTGRLRIIKRDRCRFGGIRRGEIVLLRYTTCSLSSAATRVKRAGGAAVLLVTSETPYPRVPTSFVPGLPLPEVALSLPAYKRLRDGQRITVRVDARTTRRIAENVIADSPAAGERVLMAGGHLDSVPEGPGINDNGSGVSALLAIAGRLKGASVRLGFWTAEEFGLFGSRAYVARLSSSERRRIAGYVNLDMVGSPNPVVEVYSSRNALSTALRKRLRGAGSTPYRRRDSDHDAFRRARIPVSGVYTGGREPGPGDRPRDRCYHRSCDRLGNVDMALTARAATAVAGALAQLAP